MAKILHNNHNDKTYYFSNDFEKELSEMKGYNMHDEVHIKIAETIGQPKYAERFAKFANLSSKTMEQMSERYELTKEFLRTVNSFYGHSAVKYLTQFL